MIASTLGPNKFVCSVYEGQHLNEILEMWKDIKQDCPWALAIGAPPLAAMMGGAPLPEYANEVDYVGALSGTAVEVVKCETNECRVPANSEIVFEGHISISETDVTDEGPYGEMHGYLWKCESTKYPIFTVDAITYRNGAILPTTATGRATDETHTVMGITTAALMHYALKEAGIPVLHVHLPPEANAIWAVIQIDTNSLKSSHTNSADFRKRVGETLFSSGHPGLIVHNAILVDERTNIYEFSDVVWALATRSRPNLQQTFFEDVLGYPLVPFMSHGPGGPTTKGGKVVTDALFPYQYSSNPADQHEYEICDFINGYPKELQEKVNAEWKGFGFATDP
jgi:UbiD family decarboxylase